ncbi:hypothetical protein [Lysinibacillus fusiformis]|uniref:hypothetical protein n=1 Tax=Lysinibacillus fusiformis TaxID=28031 RepID=UPI003019AE2B
MINAEQLNAIKDRVAKATPGPWRSAGLYGVRTQNDEALSIPLRPSDATFIAHAREDVPALIAEVERLLQQLEKANGLLGWAHDVLDDVHCYETDVYQEISEYFGEDD